MHSFTLLILTLSVFFASVPRGLGVSCNLSIGLSLAYPVTCSPSYLFLLDHFLIPSFPLLMSLFYLSACFFFFFLSLLLLSLCWVSWTYYQPACSVFVTGQLGRKEGRLMATEILSDSGPVQAVPMGSECFLPLWNAREHPCTFLSPERSSSTSSTFTHWERITTFCMCVCVCVYAGWGRKVLQLLKITCTQFEGVEGSLVFDLLCIRQMYGNAFKKALIIRFNWRHFFFKLINNVVGNSLLKFAVFLLDDSHFPDIPKTACRDAFLCAEHFSLHLGNCVVD